MKRFLSRLGPFAPLCIGITVVATIIFSAITIIGDLHAPRSNPTRFYSMESEGVLLRTSGKDRGGTRMMAGWIRNTNSFPVRIRRITKFYGGEQTVGPMFFLQPGSNMPVGRLDGNTGFYISTKDGGIIGYLLGDFPGEK